MTMTLERFTDTPTANRTHICTRCGGPIGRGDDYLRRATPPWLLNDCFWIIEKVCYDCQSQTGMTYVDIYNY